MEMGPQLKVSSNRLEKPGIESATPRLQGEQFIHETTVAPIKSMTMKKCKFMGHNIGHRCTFTWEDLYGTLIH